jgi:hypothetical protein
MSFLTLWPPKETSSCHAEDVQPLRTLIVCLGASSMALSGIDPQRREASGQSTAAFFRRDPGCLLLLALFVMAGRSDRRRSRWRRVVFAGISQTLEQVADQTPQSQILRRELLHFQDGGRIKTAKPTAPAIECSKRYSGGAANFADGYAGAGFVQQMQNLVFRESGMPHRVPLSKRPTPVVA